MGVSTVHVNAIKSIRSLSDEYTAADLVDKFHVGIAKVQLAVHGSRQKIDGKPITRLVIQERIVEIDDEVVKQSVIRQQLIDVDEDGQVSKSTPESVNPEDVIPELLRAMAGSGEYPGAHELPVPSDIDDMMQQIAKAVQELPESPEAQQKAMAMEGTPDASTGKPVEGRKTCNFTLWFRKQTTAIKILVSALFGAVAGLVTLAFLRLAVFITQRMRGYNRIDDQKIMPPAYSEVVEKKGDYVSIKTTDPAQGAE